MAPRVDKDAKDKLTQAEEWIAYSRVGSEQWKAAWDHIRFLLGMEEPFPVPAPEVVAAAQGIADKGLLRMAGAR